MPMWCNHLDNKLQCSRVAADLDCTHSLLWCISFYVRKPNACILEIRSLTKTFYRADNLQNWLLFFFSPSYKYIYVILCTRRYPVRFDGAGDIFLCDVIGCSDKIQYTVWQVHICGLVHESHYTTNRGRLLI